MGKSTISMAIFHSYVSLPEGISIKSPLNPIKSHHHDISMVKLPEDDPIPGTPTPATL